MPAESEDLYPEGETKYRTLFGAVTDAVFVHEVNENGVPGRFLEVNEIACERLGYTREELLTMSPLDIDAPGKDLDLKSISRRVMAGTRVTFEQIHVARDGRRYIVEINAQLLKLGKITAVLSLARDITDRKQAELALRESRERYRLLTELSPSAVTVADSTGRIRMLNRRALAVYGHEKEAEVIGRNITEWVVEVDRPKVARKFEELLGGGTVSNFELQLLRKDGSIFLGETSASLLRDAKGEVLEIIIVTTDITSRRRQEEERLKLQKLESVGRLAGGIAHDFNNLLQGVFGSISLARSHLEQPELVEELLSQVDEALVMSVNLTSQLLTFAKGGKPVKKEIDLRATIANTARLALAGSTCDLRLTFGEKLSPVNADKGQIGQVIQNIVLNACEAMPAGGTVEIDAGDVELAPGEKEPLLEGGRFVRVTIADSGGGIPTRYLSRIFDPYFTTKQKGSGLGLATSYSIITNHGGFIEAASKPEAGSQFAIYLPALSSRKTEHPPAKVAPPAGGRSGRILIMDDEEIVRNLALRMVRSLGHEGEIAADGDEAVDKLRQAREEGRPFDVVILDLTVKSGMGGEAAIKKIREIDPEVKAVVSSGYADNQLVAGFEAYGFSAALNKPYGRNDMRDCLNRLLADG